MIGREFVMNVKELYIEQSVNMIYEYIFKNLKESYLAIFLCGGASYKGIKSLRDKLKLLIERPRKYQIPMRVFYPEDLLIDALNKSKTADLLSYERFLADNSDIIAIVCESPGSLVELGAFVNSEYTMKKVIALIDKKFSKDKSFIMLGPVKYLEKSGHQNVIFYSTDEIATYEMLVKCIKEKIGKRVVPKRLEIQSIVGMHYFIQLLLYFFKILDSVELSILIKGIASKYDKKIEEFDLVFQAALKLLFHEDSIVRITGNKITEYQLTEKGHGEIMKMINRCTNAYQCDKIRVNIMYSQYYRTPRS